MGFFGTYLYEDGRWTDVEPGTDLLPDSPAGRPRMLVDIHDSDLTTITYRPMGNGTGTAYLGVTPRTYFEDENASAPTDVVREAAGLTAWWAGVHAQRDRESLITKEAELLQYLAQDVDPEDDDLDDGDETDVDALDDLELFVERKTARLLTALDLPLPADLPG